MLDIGDVGDGLHCPLCSGRKPDLHDLDTLLIDILDTRGLSEAGQAVLETCYMAAGRPVLSDALFDRIYDHDPDGGPSFPRMYADLRAALAELDAALSDTGLTIVPHGRRNGWRLTLTEGAYVSV